MQSGDFTISRVDDHHQQEFAEIEDRAFVQRTFVSTAALVRNDGKLWRQYTGQPFDSSDFSIVEGRWDHEHCSVCLFAIKEGYTYWENTDRIKLLCDACHEAMLKT